MMRLRPLLQIFLATIAIGAYANISDDLNAAHDAAHTGNLPKLADLAHRIDGSPLEMYPHYWLLTAQIDKTPDQDISAFMNHYAGSYLADKLRADWLRSLGKRGAWETFEQEWPKLVQTVDTGSDLQCYRLQLAAVKHDDNLLVGQGKPLWFTDKGLPEACAPMFDALFERGALTDDDAWIRIRWVLAANNPEFATQLLAHLNHPAGIDAKKITAVATHPDKAISSLNLATRGGRELAIFAVLRSAHSNLDNGPLLVSKLEDLPQSDRQYIWTQLGVLAMRKLDPRALNWFQHGLPAYTLTPENRATYARAALRQRDWAALSSVIDAMPQEEQQQTSWLYWRARAYLQAGNTQEANRLLIAAANDTNFYGLLAREDVGTMVDVSSGHYHPNDDEIKATRELPGIQRALALYELDWRTEAVREWNWAMRNLTDQQLLASAEIARQAGWYDRAIYSAEHTQSLHDYNLRYLSPYRDTTQVCAKNLNLDEAWVYGLIRQESRFVTVAHSSVGAHGLMQLMPGTARWVARKLGISYNPSAVNEVGTNIQLGTYYLKQVLDSLGQQPVLATAAYNAGPGRARAWLADKPMEGAIYAETIPFTETRDYVKKVMANSVYYARAFGSGETSIKRRLGTIPARNTNDATLDLP